MAVIISAHCNIDNKNIRSDCEAYQTGIVGIIEGNRKNKKKRNRISLSFEDIVFFCFDFPLIVEFPPLFRSHLAVRPVGVR